MCTCKPVAVFGPETSLFTLLHYLANNVVVSESICRSHTYSCMLGEYINEFGKKVGENGF